MTRPSKLLDQLRRCPRVELVDDERDIGNGILVTLRQGWTFTAGEDNRVFGEDTVTQAMAGVRSAQPFAGPYAA